MLIGTEGARHRSEKRGRGDTQIQRVLEKVERKCLYSAPTSAGNCEDKVVPLLQSQDFSDLERLGA